MDAQQRATELKAANTVRRIIQKVRLATPETFDALEVELFDCMEQQMEGVGSLHAKVQEELEKGLELARNRVEQIKEKREKEEEMAQRPKELIEEIKELMEVMQARLSTLKMAACLDGTPGVKLQADDAEAVRKMAEEVAGEIKEFSQACVTHATEIKEATLPPLMKQTWTALAHEIVEVKRKAEVTVLSCKAATFKATEALRKQQLEEMKVSFRIRVKDASAAVPIAEESVAVAEQTVEPFVKGKAKEESEMLAMAERVDEALTEANAALSSAKQEAKSQAEELEEDMDEMLKKEIKVFILSEEKIPKMRLGQLERRLTRVSNIVARYRKEKDSVKNKGVIESLKAELLEKVKETAGSPNVEDAEPSIKEAEKAVEPCAKHKTMQYAEMAELAEQATKAVDGAKAAIEAVHQELCPIDESLDEEVKKKLRDLAAPYLKKPQVKLGQFERRLVRVSNILASFKSELGKKQFSQHDKARQAMRRVVRHHLSTHEMTADALFEKISAQSADSSVIDKAAFLGFFETAETTVKKAGTEEEEAIELVQEELAALFASHCTRGEEAIKKDAFIKAIGARLTVAKATTLTTVLSIAEGKVVRALRLGEELEPLEGPVKEGKVGVMRIRVRCLKDDKMGWATLFGNAGSVFLKEGA